MGKKDKELRITITKKKDNRERKKCYDSIVDEKRQKGAVYRFLYILTAV